MNIVVVTRPDYFKEESIQVNQLFNAGMELLHIRKPGNDSGKFSKLLKEIDPVFYNRIAIHQHHELAEEFSLKRLHYPEQLRKLTGNTELRKKQEKGFTLSSSVHELHVLPALQFLDYVFFGPVFKSISKPGYESVLPPAFSLPSRPDGPGVVAIGGITPSLLEAVKQMNFNGAALLGAVWTGSSGPVEILKSVNKNLKKND